MCLLFGIVPSTMYVWFDFSLEVGMKQLKLPGSVDFEVCWTNRNERRASALLLETNRKYRSALRGVL